VPNALSPTALATRRAVHRAIATVTENLDGFRFNVAVAQIRTLSNALEALDGKGASSEDGGEAWALREGLEALAKLLAPMVPHLAEDMWAALGHDRLLCFEPWPKADPALLVQDTVKVAVQVNGKLRATLDLARDCDEAHAKDAALAQANVQAAIGGKPLRKVVFVPNRILNLVV
jgi:leucyl-tRNA synthetase